jgi:hypothetical protein
VACAAGRLAPADRAGLSAGSLVFSGLTLHQNTMETKDSDGTCCCHEVSSDDGEWRGGYRMRTTRQARCVPVLERR